jgi:PAS domain S-box-containing protein
VTGLPNQQSGLFEAFLGSAQYIARIKRQQDLWEHAGRFIVAHFPAEWVAFAQKRSEGEISVHSCTSSDRSLNETLAGPEVTVLVDDVLESGFLASEVLRTAAPMMTALLPVNEEYQTRAVMLVGHKTVHPISADLLNVYLALAGLVGTTWERLRNEEELAQHRAYLEELVGERTRELREAQEQTELILHSVGEGICGLDLEGRITFVNPFAAESLGWDSTALLGRDAHGTFHHAHPGGRPYPVDECSVHAIMMGQPTGPVSGEQFLRRDGTPIPVEFSMAPITEDGETIGAVLVFRDITERVRAEKERERLLARQQDLGEELAALNEKLQAQNEDLAAQGEELEAQNEELRGAQAEAGRLLEEQRAVLHRLQVALLDIPHQLSQVRFGHLYRSATKEAQIGGDFYDVFQAKNGRVGLLIGDVSGHGVDAARVATLVKDTVHAFSHQFRRPHLVLRETNRLLVEKDLPGFTTAFLGFLDPVDGRLVYSSAGHPPPLLKVGGAVTLLESPNVSLGVFADAHYRDSEVEIPEASLLLLYTDGITEARNGDAFFGEGSLTSALVALGDEPIETLPSLLLQAALSFSGGRLADDAALLAVSFQPKTHGEKVD